MLFRNGGAKFDVPQSKGPCRDFRLGESFPASNDFKQVTDTWWARGARLEVMQDDADFRFLQTHEHNRHACRGVDP